MTERWRKKLGDLDKAGPSDDVFERAKRGDWNDTASDQPRTSTRLVAGAVAFAVFALALSISVPMLHRGNTTTAVESPQAAPLWPSQSFDELRALQASADAGGAPWALEPRAVAMRFGQQVMGWSEVDAGRMDDPGCIFLGASPYPMLGNTGGCSSPSPSPDGFVTYRLIARCHTAGSDEVWSPCVPDVPPEAIQLYQPLGSGEGHIWVVNEAQSSFPYVDLTVSAGQRVPEGASVGADVTRSEGTYVALGYAVCGKSVVTSRKSDTNDEQLDTAVTFGGTECRGDVPGYVWGAGSVSEFPSAFDPFDRPMGQVLSSLTAVPVTFVMGNPGTSDETAPTPTVSGQERSWTTYTDPMGWTIDVPQSWDARSIANTTVTGIGGSGEEFSGDGVTLDVFQGEAWARPADDSTFPLDYDSLLSQSPDGALIGMFRGDGVAFSVRITANDPPLDPGQEAVVRRMVGSISFEPWEQVPPGVVQVRNGWRSLQRFDHDPKSMQDAGVSWQCWSADSCYVAFYGTEMPLVLGPVSTCGQGESLMLGADASSAYPIELRCADGATQAWSGSGEPAPANVPPHATVLGQHPLIRAWDGTYLTNIEVGNG